MGDIDESLSFTKGWDRDCGVPGDRILGIPDLSGILQGLDIE